MSKTREEIIDLAESLIRTRGYHAFSYKDVSTPLNIKNAAVHYHFPAKEDLGIAIIEKTRTSFRYEIDLWKNNSALEKIKSFIHVYETSQNRNMVCIMGALGASFDTLPDRMQQALTNTSIEIKDWLNNVLMEGLETGEFHFEESPQTWGNMIVGALLSSLILNKVTKQDILTSVKDAILNSL